MTNIIIVSLAMLLAMPAITQAADSDYDPQKAAAERIRQQLELANQLKAERLERERRQAKDEEASAQRTDYCNKARDSLQQYEQARLRWYQLDEKGERVYLTEDEINRRKDDLRQKIASHCSD